MILWCLGVLWERCRELKESYNIALYTFQTLGIQFCKKPFTFDFLCASCCRCSFMIPTFLFYFPKFDCRQLKCMYDLWMWTFFLFIWNLKPKCCVQGKNYKIMWKSSITLHFFNVFIWKLKKNHLHFWALWKYRWKIALTKQCLVQQWCLT